MKNYISPIDFIDFYCKLKQKGIKFIWKNFSFFSNHRVQNKWDTFTSSADFWLIPAVQKRWNFLISNDENCTYEEYTSKKYLNKMQNLNMLSIGCGNGNHERNFAQFLPNAHFTGIDISKKSIDTANELAHKEQVNANYLVMDFEKENFTNTLFDVVLFNASLHHFKNVEQTLIKVKNLLKPNGLLIVFEYVGANKLQHSAEQLKQCNKILKTLPKKHRIYLGGNFVKTITYKPGLLRMQIIDPSEAIDSINIVNALHKHYKTLEETPLGWNIIQPLFKGIAHHFFKEDKPTKELLTQIFTTEDNFIKHHPTDAIFGVYVKE